METNASGLCTKGCGFFGNDAYEGMCSKCYKDNVKRQNQEPSGTPAQTATAAPTPTPTPTPAAKNTTETTTTTATAASSATTELKVDTQLPPKETTPPVDIPKPKPATETPAVATSSSPSSVDKTESSSPAKTKKRNRCVWCKKKVGLTGFECRCGGLYCGLHRYSDEHNCTFDYKTEGRERLAEANPVIVGEKIKKI